MTLDELNAAVAEKAGLTKADAGKAVSAVLGAIQGELAKGGKVALPGFGNFEVTERGEREGRNPRTGETMTIAASRSVKFKPGKRLKDAVNG